MRPSWEFVDDLARTHTTDAARFDLLRRCLNDQEIVDVLLAVGARYARPARYFASTS
jgi:hypothetical protein